MANANCLPTRDALRMPCEHSWQEFKTSHLAALSMASHNPSILGSINKGLRTNFYAAILRFSRESFSRSPIILQNQRSLSDWKFVLWASLWISTRIPFFYNHLDVFWTVLRLKCVYVSEACQFLKQASIDDRQLVWGPIPAPASLNGEPRTSQSWVCPIF